MNGIKGYSSIQEASYLWCVSERRVNQSCAEGRIPGVSRFGRPRALPADAEKPSDPRIKNSKEGGKHDLR
ncbi:MAG: DNA-binding protein [Dysosmobacter sp.]|nr:DNA-binding protein [Dysosmobacter sp.]